MIVLNIFDLIWEAINETYLCVELKRLLISTIFDKTLTYSNKIGIQTSEIPLVYAEKLEQDKNPENKKNSHHTNPWKYRWELM